MNRGDGEAGEMDRGDNENEGMSADTIELYM